MWQQEPMASWLPVVKPVALPLALPYAWVELVSDTNFIAISWLDFVTGKYYCIQTHGRVTYRLVGQEALVVKAVTVKFDSDLFPLPDLFFTCWNNQLTYLITHCLQLFGKYSFPYMMFTKDGPSYASFRVIWSISSTSRCVPSLWGWVWRIYCKKCEKLLVCPILLQAQEPHFSCILIDFIIKKLQIKNPTSEINQTQCLYISWTSV